MGIFTKKPDYQGAAWLTYWDGPDGEASRCFVEYLGDDPMRGHLPAASQEAVVTYHMRRGLDPPIVEMLEFAASARASEGEDIIEGVAFPPGGPEFLSARPDDDAVDRWVVGLSLFSFPKKRAVLSEVEVRYGAVYDPIMDDHAWAADKAVRAWFDYLRWVVSEAHGAGALITREVVTAIECASEGRLLPAGRAAWEAAEKTKEWVDAALRARAESPR